MLLIVAIGLQVRAGMAFLQGDLFDADQPAHFVTGVMVHDLLRKAHFPAPIAFARCFYVQYPKVALGHWPPVFYIVEALWFLIFGTKTIAARWLCACLAGACGLALYSRCRTHWGRWHALAACALFLAFPWVQRQSWQVMSDLLLAGLVFVAIGSFSDYLTGGGWRRAIWFAVFTSCAILTKGTGWLLFLPIAAGPFITGRRRIYASWSYWLGVALTCAASAPFFIAAELLHLGYPTKIEGHIHRLHVMLSQVSIWQSVAGGFLLIVLIFTACRLWRMNELKPSSVLGSLLLFWVLSQALFIALVPLTPELNRYYVPSLAPGAFLLTGIVFASERWLNSRHFRYGALVSSLTYAGIMAVFASTRLNEHPTLAFSEAVATVPAVRGQIVLVESDAAGEGALIAAQLERDRNRLTYILRGTKFLSHSDWNGSKYSLTYSDPLAVRDAIVKTGLTYVIVDTSARARPDTEMLTAALDDASSNWEVAERIPLAAGARGGEVVVYHRVSDEHAARVPLSVQLGPERAGQTLTCPAWPD